MARAAAFKVAPLQAVPTERGHADAGGSWGMRRQRIIVF
jgi:hypothetical protein